MITSNVQSSNDNTPSPLAAQNTDRPAVSDSDFQSFLTLLTAQLRNQDPLSPLDSTQFVEQLASFSAVEQQIETNNHLEALAGNFTAAGLEDAVQWIGKEVEIENGAALFQGEPLEFRIPQSASGGAPEIIVSDQSGRVVFEGQPTEGRNMFVWAGQNNSGDPASHGAYSIKVNYTTDEGVVDTKTPISIADVSEARLVDGAVKLVLDNGASVEPADILAVRNAAQQGNNEDQSEILAGNT